MNTRQLNLKAAKHTEIHITDDGYIGIEQDYNYCGHTAVVKLTPDQAALLIEEVRALVESREKWWVPAWEGTKLMDVEQEPELCMPGRPLIK